jgi:hypothetical protein
VIGREVPIGDNDNYTRSHGWAQGRVGNDVDAGTHRIVGGSVSTPAHTLGESVRPCLGDWRAGLSLCLCSLLPRPFGCEVSQHRDNATFLGSRGRVTEPPIDRVVINDGRQRTLLILRSTCPTVVPGRVTRV